MVVFIDLRKMRLETLHASLKKAKNKANLLVSTGTFDSLLDIGDFSMGNESFEGRFLKTLDVCFRSQ